jgi:hypothetical protein
MRTTAARSRRLVGSVVRTEALRAHPGFQQHTINREVLARQQALDLVLRQNRGQELAHHFAVQQPVAVIGEAGCIPYRILDAKPDKAAERQVILDPLDQLTFRADRAERLQQQVVHQTLWRDRRLANRRIQLGKLAGKRFERRISNLANHPQWIIRPSPLLDTYKAEKANASAVPAAHRCRIPQSQGTAHTTVACYGRDRHPVPHS